jgi:hypothetical protein
MHLILTVIVIAIVLYILFKAAKVLIKILAVVAIVVLAYFTNPDLLDHRNAAKEKAAKEDLSISANDINVKDLKIFSLTESRKGIIGIGAFTKVWIFRL